MITYGDHAESDPLGVVGTHRQTILGGLSAAGAVGLQRDDCIWLDRPLAATAAWAWVSIAAFQQANLIAAAEPGQLSGDQEAGDACTVVITDPGRDAASLTELERLRLVIFDGPMTAATLQAHVAAWEKLGRPAPRFAATLSYPEAGPFALIARPEDIAASPGCLGTPLPGSYARIARADGSEPPHGEAGEIQLRSPFVMDGYYRRPERTAGAFCGGWLRTGIPARRSGDGCYHAAEATAFHFQNNA
jgi:acyl-CoA synthetase (AMP-forming)/AMP-acid ligase II